MTSDPVRSELKRLMRYANAARVASALGVSRATAARWSRGESGDELALSGVRRLLGHEEAAPLSESGAAAELLRLWTGTAPPPWADSLTSQVKAMLEDNRQLITEALRIMVEQQGDDTRRLVSEEVRRALDEVEQTDPPQPDDATSPVRNGSTPGEVEPSGD